MSVGTVDTEYYSFIDGLRGVAVLAVVAVHSAGTAGAPLHNAVLDRLANSGARGVQLFFILSAFTLFSTSLQRFPKELRPRRNFYLRRAFRILPLWWAALGLYVFADKHGLRLWGEGDISPASIGVTASLLFGFFAHRFHSLVPGGFTIFDEETFYLLLPLLYSHVRSLSQAALLSLVLLVASVAWFVGCRIWLPHDGDYIAFSFFFPLAQWFVFGYGFVLFFTLRLVRPGALSASTLYFADAVVAILLWASLVGVSIGPQHYAAATALLGLAFCAGQNGSLWNRVIDTPVLRAFGRCCYSIYLLHFLIIGVAQHYQVELYEMLRAPTHPDARFLIWYAMVASICLACGSLSFYLFERPLVRLGRRLIHGLEKRDAAGLAAL